MIQYGQLRLLVTTEEKEKIVRSRKFVYSKKVEWTVDHSIFNSDGKQKIYSEPVDIRTGHPLDTIWRLMLRLDDDNSVYMCLAADENQMKVVQHRASLTYSFRGEGEREEPTEYSTSIHDFEYHWDYKKQLPIDRPDLLEVARKYKKLVVTATITGYSGDLQDFVIYQQQQKMATLFDKQLGGFTIRAEGRDLKAHKWMLAMGSPVFARLFRNKFKMAQVMLTGRRLEKELSYKTTHDMLKFLYTAIFTQHMDAAELLVAAHKYDIGALKLHCIKRLLVTEVTMANSCQFYHLGVVYEPEKLALKAEKAARLIHDNKDAAMATEGWQKYLAGPKNIKVLEKLYPMT